FFQAEDGIRDFHVTGVQTCALPILQAHPESGAAALARLIPDAATPALDRDAAEVQTQPAAGHRAVPAQRKCPEKSRQALERHREIGRASCRGRVEIAGVGEYVANNE